MNKKLYVLIFCLLVLLAFFAGCTGGPRAFNPLWEYSIEIKADGPIENVTFIIPLPVLNGTPIIGDVVLKPDDFAKGNVTAEFTRNPPGLDLTGADDLGYEPCFVVLHADMLVPEESKYPPNVYRIDKGDNVQVYDIDDFINTLNPIGNESLIVPKYNFIWQEPKILEIKKTNIIYAEQSSFHMIPVFVSYQSESYVDLDLNIYFRRWNQWKQGYDAWTGNNLHECYFGEFRGPQDSWLLIDGYLKLEDGIFPNLESPEWQELIKNSSKE